MISFPFFTDNYEVREEKVPALPFAGMTKGRALRGVYFVSMVTLPAPLLAVISTLSAALSKLGDW